MRWALLVVLVATPALADLFSPGDLAKAHESLEGLRSCTQCHPAGGQLSQETCLDCHDELKPGIGKGKGLHGRLTAAKRNCEECHHEHQGRAASLIEWGTGGKKGFDHRRAGWPLEGKHAKTECKDCHEPRLITWPAAQKLLKVRQTYLGVETRCNACHFDEHRGQVEDDCAACHDEKGWSPAPGFDHDQTDYALKGRHKRVKCKACHSSVKDLDAHTFPKPVSETYLSYDNVPHAACTDCHKDPHENRFGQRCQSCHSVQGWHIVRNASKEREFHDKTRFKLEGAHLDVECQSCHGPFPGQKARFKNMAFKECSDCHADAHVGQLAKSAANHCERCHSLEAFSPTQYDLEAHAKARYPLEGAHTVVPCERCHPATPALANKVSKTLQKTLTRQKRKLLFSTALLHLAALPKGCDTCHDDVHQGQFAKTKGGCDTCHQVASFTKLSFDHQKDSRFPLTGKHLDAACGSCHVAKDAKTAVLYRPLAKECAECHADVHARQFLTQGQPTACDACHDTKDFAPAAVFRHEPPFTDYRLDGQHAKAKCGACHPSVDVGGGAKAVRYTGLPRECEGCHTDFHQGAFEGFEP